MSNWLEKKNTQLKKQGDLHQGANNNIGEKQLRIRGSFPSGTGNLGELPGGSGKAAGPLMCASDVL